MRYGYLGLGMILFGAFGLVLIVMFQTITINNDSEYYVLKEAMEASMLEAIDESCFRITPQVAKELGQENNSCDGQVKISEQKFVENFTRRFAATINGDVDDYTIDFYDIMELPPKASVVIKSSNTNFKVVSDSIDITNSLSGILEANWNKISDNTTSNSECKSNENSNASSTDTSNIGAVDVPNSSVGATTPSYSEPDDVGEPSTDASDVDVGDEDSYEDIGEEDICGEDDE